MSIKNLAYEILFGKNSDHESKLIAIFESCNQPSQYLPYSGFTPLMAACINNFSKLARQIFFYLEQDLNYQNCDGDTALIIACRQNLYDIANLLIDFHADVNLYNNKGENALYTVIKTKDSREPYNRHCGKYDPDDNYKLGSKLLYHNADFSRYPNILWLAACQFKINIGLKLIASGADINHVHDNKSVLTISLEHNLDKLILELVRQDALIIPTEYKPKYMTPIIKKCFAINADKCPFIIENVRYFGRSKREIIKTYLLINNSGLLPYLPFELLMLILAELFTAQ